MAWVRTKRDIVLYVLIFAASAYLYTTLEGLEYETRAFPAALLIGLMAVCAIGLVMTLAGKVSAAAKHDQQATSKLAKFCFTFLGAVAYALAIPFLGFYASSIVFVLMLMFLLGSRSWLAMILTALGTIVLLYVVFSMFLHVPLPRGLFM